MKKYDQRFTDLESARQVVLECLRRESVLGWISITELRALTDWPTRNGPGLVELNTAVNDLARRGLVEFKDGWDCKSSLPARVRLATTPAAPATENT